MVGADVTIAPVVELSPFAGLHVYVVAPVAVRFTLLPEHIEDVGGVTVTVGVVPTVTTTESTEVHEPLAPVTVYVVITVGVAITVPPVVALNPVAGLHV